MADRDTGGLPPLTDRIETPDATDDGGDSSDLPADAVEEARRWKDVPMDEPEESTGTDV